MFSKERLNFHQFSEKNLVEKRNQTIDKKLRTIYLTIEIWHISEICFTVKLQNIPRISVTCMLGLQWVKLFLAEATLPFWNGIMRPTFPICANCAMYRVPNSFFLLKPEILEVYFFLFYYCSIILSLLKIFWTSISISFLSSFDLRVATGANWSFWL